MSLLIFNKAISLNIYHHAPQEIHKWGAEQSFRKLLSDFKFNDQMFNNNKQPKIMWKSMTASLKHLIMTYLLS